MVATVSPAVRTVGVIDTLLATADPSPEDADAAFSAESAAVDFDGGPSVVVAARLATTVSLADRLEMLDAAAVRTASVERSLAAMDTMPAVDSLCFLGASTNSSLSSLCVVVEDAAAADAVGTATVLSLSGDARTSDVSAYHHDDPSSHCTLYDTGAPAGKATSTTTPMSPSVFRDDKGWTGL